MTEESQFDSWQGKRLFFSQVTRLALEPTQPPVQWRSDFFLGGGLEGGSG